MEALFTTAEQSSGCAILTHILFMVLLFVPPPQIQKSLSKVFFAVFAVVLVFLVTGRKGRITYQPRDAWNSFWCRQYLPLYLDFCTKRGSAVFSISVCFTLAWEYSTIIDWVFTLFIYAVKFHHLETTPCCSQYSNLFHLSCSFQAAVFEVDVNFWDLRTLFHPTLNSDFTPWSDHWFSNFCDFPNQVFHQVLELQFSSSSWDSCTFYPLWRFFAAMPPWQSWGQSSWNNWRDDKNKYQFDSDEALQYPEVVTPNTWKSTSTFYDENVFFGLQFHRTIQPTNFLPLDMFRRH